jgi:hypothetical protein
MTGGFMRTLGFAIAATIGLMLPKSEPANAFGRNHPFCLQGDEFPGLSNCTFDSYAQCQAMASGRFLTCIANPYFVGQTDEPYADRNRNRVRPSDYYSPR